MRDVNLVKRNISKMIEQNAPESDIDEYVASEGYTPEMLRGEQPTQVEQPQDATQESGGSTLGNLAKGLPVGLGRAATGFIQAATDLGERAARRAEKAIYGDTMDQQTFGDRLAGQVQQQNKQLAQEPLSTRIGVGIGESLPYLATGAGTGSLAARGLTSASSKLINPQAASILAKTANLAGKSIKAAAPVVGLATSGAVGGAVQGGLSPQEEAGIDNRIAKTKETAALGAAFGAGLGVAQKAIAEPLIETAKYIKGGLKSKSMEELADIGKSIAEKSSSLYKSVDDSGLIIQPKAAKELFNNINNSVIEGGRLLKTNNPKTIGILQDIQKDFTKTGGKITLSELDSYRKALSSAAQEAITPLGKTTDDGRRLKAAVRAIDNFIDSSSPKKMFGVKDDAGIKDTYRQAQATWKKYSKFENVANLVKKADGDPNRLKTLVKNFVDNEKKTSGFSPEEIKALELASRNSTTEGLLKAVGKFGFDIGSGRNIGNTVIPGASILYGGGIGATTASVGTAARQAQKLAARGKIEDVLNIIQGTKPKDAQKIINSLSPSVKSVILTNLLTKSVEQ